MEDKEIVKALECCARPLPHCYCGECPAGANGGCAIKTENIIDLINRLQAENEELKTENRILSQKRFNIFERIEYTDKLKNNAYKEFARELMLIPSNTVRKDEIRNLLREKVGNDES